MLSTKNLFFKKKYHKKAFFRYYLIAFLTTIFSLSSLLFMNSNASLPSHDSQGLVIPSLAPMLSKITDAVVNISTSSTAKSSLNYSDDFFKQLFNYRQYQQHPQTEEKQHNLGSGVIINASSGYVITNNHVIRGTDNIVVTLKDGRKFTAEIIGTDSKTDISLLKIPANKLTEIKLSDSDILRVGDFAIAIGNPFGLGQTVTSGIISALGRNNLGIEGYEDFIQTDASINPGNSGGALVNLYGELIGINTAILSKSGGNVGIGFAIPINMVKNIKEQLIKHGRVTRGLLGVQIQDLTPDLASALGTQQINGAIVAKVFKNSAAQTAGLKNGDIITKSNNKIIKNSADLRNSIGLMRPGEEVVLQLLRGNEQKIIRATITSENNLPLLTADNFDAKQLHPSLSGAILAQQLSSQGVVIAELKRGSIAWKTGLRVGDKIISINRYEIHSIADIKQLSKQLNNHHIAINILRGNMGLFLVLE